MHGGEVKQGGGLTLPGLSNNTEEFVTINKLQVRNI
jgi:hypothetical protein